MNNKYIPGIDISDVVQIDLPLFGDSFQIPDGSDENCRSYKEFEINSCSRVGELEEFYQCLDNRNGYKQVTLVKYKEFTSQNKELKVLVREIAIIKKLKHSNILKFLEPAVYRLASVHLVFEPIPCFISDIIHYEVVELYNPSVVKSVMSQLLSGLDYIHEHGVMHRNIHPNNLALGSNGELKICNFRNARYLWDKDLSLEVEEFRYQSPEALMELSLCSSSADIWSAACIFVELLLEKNFFTGRNISSVLSEVFSIFGFPSEQSWPKFFELPESTFLSEELSNFHRFNFLKTHFKKELRIVDDDTMDLLQAMFCLDPTERPKASGCLSFLYFKKEPKACKHEELKSCINIALTKRETSSK